MKRRRGEGKSLQHMPAYRKQVEAFRRKFGREMTPEDPLFFDPRSDRPQFRPPDDARLALDILAELKAEIAMAEQEIHAEQPPPKVLTASAGFSGY
ncbi:MAG TPA: hypothetical protein VMS37_26900 [Verrucomicrobiae bacterium]|nr:hypothetical protein [Verrucomicrobiae bacterium]